MLVGRRTELELIAERVATDRAIVVVGEAGVGKTALLRAAVSSSGAETREGGALRTLSWSPYLLFERALGTGLEGRDHASILTTIDAALRGRVLIADDLQWAHASSIRVLTELVGRVALLAAVRSGDEHADDVLTTLAEGGFDVVRLGPLDDEASTALLRSLRPELSETSIGRLIRRAGGNPFLLEELAGTGEPSETLRLGLRARLRDLAPPARRGLMTLAVAGHPVPRRDVDGADRLIDVGLAVDGVDGIALRHALIGEVIADELDAEGRAQIHERLARAATEPAVAAQHFAAIGRRSDAANLATRAAASAAWPHERAALLGLAARCADGPDATGLRLRAARELWEADEFDRSDDVLGELDDYEGEARVGALIAMSRNHWSRGDRDAALDLVADAAKIATSGTAGALLVELQRLTIDPFGDGPEAAMARIGRAVSEADRLGAHRAWARTRFATLSLMAAVPEWEERMRDAIRVAQDERDVVSELQGSGNLAVGLQSLGRVDEARAVTADLLVRTRELRLTGWQRRIASQNFAYQLTFGEFDDLLAEARELLDQPLDPRARAEVESFHAHVLTLRGHYDEAIARLDVLVPSAPDDVTGRWRLEYAKVNALLWSGRHARALPLAEGLAPRVQGTWLEPVVRIAIAYARYELALDPGDAIDTDIPTYEALMRESRALSLLYDARWDEAAEIFTAIADELENAEVSTRNRWMAGESLRLAGRHAAALDALGEAESRAIRFGIEPLLVRIRRSIRLAGKRRSAPRTRGARGDVTDREREVLRLVSDGLTNPEIARRLGVSRSTVARTISSASIKLGVRSRVEAAAAVVDREPR